MNHQTAVLFDHDDALVDSAYQHVLAWRQALEPVRGLWDEARPVLALLGVAVTAMLMTPEAVLRLIRGAAD